MAAAFELTRNITVGQYIPTGSVVHRFDPRIKLVGFGVLVLAIAFCGSYVGNLLALTFCLALFPLIRIPVGYGASGIKPAIPFILVIALLQLLFSGSIAPGGGMYFEYGVIQVTGDSIRLVIVSAMRFVEVIFLSSALTFTTSTTDLTRGMESLLRPLEKVRFPVHAFALILTIAIRFVPTFAMEMEKLMKAQASRGADFGSGGWWRIIRRTRDMFPLIIPLFNMALTRAEDLILAMESRGYVPGEERSVYTRYRSRWTDWAALGACAVLAFIILWLPESF